MLGYEADMYQKSYRCPDCDEGSFRGNGRCSKCHGSGVNLRLTSEEPKCPACDGTGVCATCQGEGVYPSVPPDASPIQTLFTTKEDDDSEVDPDLFIDLG